ncbi:uncharacterized protein LOC132101859 isoform X2 [Carassius carassius]|uniref:uncharacterized protein LOC132101859 isoform X2 n=1 Tax=Carassius carassius TaxID=217509 RepID=UPI002869459E|nr:uncharacterized protein LOC132101859 isoform X2 [Carassius carassius]
MASYAWVIVYFFTWFTRAINSIPCLGFSKLFHVNNSIDMERECILKALCVYLKKDHLQLFKEYNDCDWMNAKEAIEQMVMGIYIVQSTGHQPGDKPVDVGILIEGTEVLCSLKNVAVAVTMLFGLTYALNHSYPQELKAIFEVFQKVFFILDGQKLSPKVQAPKNKILE